MPEDYEDPSGNTEAFRAFARAADPIPESSPRRIWIIAGLVAAVVVIVAAVAWLVTT